MVSMERLWEIEFWSKVDVLADDECWPWLGVRKRKGYGVFGAKSPGSKSFAECGEIAAHRIMWVIVHGPIPDGLLVLHKCDNPPCVNPSHLYVGGAGDNAMDMVERGRGVSLGTKRRKHPLLTRSIF